MNDRSNSSMSEFKIPKPPLAELPSDIAAVDVFLFRVPLKEPRINSFGRMTHRSALVVRLRDNDGFEGWGECFSNWPAFAADHRFKIITEILAPLIMGRKFKSPVTLAQHLVVSTRAIRIQSDERGPFDQSIAALDIAAWDLAARRINRPLHQVLGGDPDKNTIRVYGSGIMPKTAAETAAREYEKGIRAFKMKVGFGLETDLEGLTALRQVVGKDTRLMVDANQGWTVSQATDAIQAFEEFSLDWVEEPIPADSSPENFFELSKIGTPIAVGENVRGKENFSDLMSVGGISVVQPDVIKWGGISGCYEVAAEALARGLRYCPHYLAGGIGLMASIHLLAALGGNDFQELDVATNPFRTLLAQPFPEIRDGKITLPDLPGLGVEPDLEALDKFCISKSELVTG